MSQPVQKKSAQQPMKVLVQIYSYKEPSQLWIDGCITIVDKTIGLKELLKLYRQMADVIVKKWRSEQVELTPAPEGLDFWLPALALPSAVFEVLDYLRCLYGSVAYAIVLDQAMPECVHVHEYRPFKLDHEAFEQSLREALSSRKPNASE